MSNDPAGSGNLSATNPQVLYVDRNSQSSRESLPIFHFVWQGARAKALAKQNGKLVGRVVSIAPQSLFKEERTLRCTCPQVGTIVVQTLLLLTVDKQVVLLGLSKGQFCKEEVGPPRLVYRPELLLSLLAKCVRSVYCPCLSHTVHARRRQIVREVEPS